MILKQTWPRSRLDDDRIDRSRGGSTLKFDLGDDGVIFIDATSVPNKVHNDDVDAACTVRVAHDDLEAMLKGDLDPMAAFSLGKLQLDGDMGVAMKLGNLMK